jgi:hypothetical protein
VSCLYIVETQWKLIRPRYDVCETILTEPDMQRAFT